MAICELICWGILLGDLECKTDRHHDFVALQNLSVVCPFYFLPLIVLGVFDLLGSSDEVLNCLKSAFVTDQADKKFPRHSKKSVQNRDIFLWRFTVMHPF